MDHEERTARGRVVVVCWTTETLEKCKVICIHRCAGCAGCARCARLEPTQPSLITRPGLSIMREMHRLPIHNARSVADRQHYDRGTMEPSPVSINRIRALTSNRRNLDDFLVLACSTPSSLQVLHRNHEMWRRPACMCWSSKAAILTYRKAQSQLRNVRKLPATVLQS